jgi:hypothetical protein
VQVGRPERSCTSGESLAFSSLCTDTHIKIFSKDCFLAGVVLQPFFFSCRHSQNVPQTAASLLTWQLLEMYSVLHSSVTESETQAGTQQPIAASPLGDRQAAENTYLTVNSALELSCYQKNKVEVSIWYKNECSKVTLTSRKSSFLFQTCFDMMCIQSMI